MELTMRNNIKNVTLTPLVADTETAIEWSESDEKMVLVVSAESETDLTILKGNSAMAGSDVTFTVDEGVSLVKLESGKFKNVSGTNKGKIVVKSTGTPSVGVCAMV